VRQQVVDPGRWVRLKTDEDVGETRAFVEAAKELALRAVM